MRWPADSINERKVPNMAKGKKAGGRKVRTFTYEGKRYYIYGRTNKELNEKEYQKRAGL